MNAREHSATAEQDDAARGVPTSRAAGEPRTARQTGSRRGKRLLVLLLALVVCAVIAFFQRDRLAEVPNTWARAGFAAHDHERARYWLQWSSRISAKNPETELLWARYYRRQGRFDDASRHLERAGALGLAAEMLQREQLLGMAQAGQLREAEPFLPHLLADPRDEGPEISEAFVIGYLRSRQFGSATLLLNAWIQDHPLDPQPHYWKALIDRENDRPEAAERALRWALDLQPGHSQAAFALGEVLYEDKRLAEEAIPFYQLAKQDPSQSVAATAAIARCLRTLGRSDEAQRETAAALREHPESKELVLELANSLIDEGNYRAAAERLRPFQEMHPEDRDFRYLYGVALRGSGKLSEAKSHLEFANEASKELGRAGRLIREANLQPENAEVRYQIGSVLLKYGSVKDGLIWLESVLQIDPDHQPTHRILADYYERRARTDGSQFKQLAARHRAKLGATSDADNAP